MSIDNQTEQAEMGKVGMAFRKVSQIVKFSDFTDDGSDAVGDLVMNKQVPAGSFVLGVKVTVKTGFVGDTTAILAVGAAKDGNDWSGNSTINVLAAGRNKMASAFLSTDGGIQAISSDNSVYLGITGTSDFTLITAGEMLVEVFYLSTNVELTDAPKNEIDL